MHLKMKSSLIFLLATKTELMRIRVVRGVGECFFGGGGSGGKARIRIASV